MLSELTEAYYREFGDDTKRDKNNTHMETCTLNYLAVALKPLSSITLHMRGDNIFESISETQVMKM